MEHLSTVRNDESRSTMAGPKPMGFAQRVAGIIFSPAKTMEDLIARPRILFPVILIAISMLLFLLVNLDLYKEYTIQMAEAAMNRMNVELPSEQIAKQAEIGAIAGLVTAPIGALIAWLVGTAILFGVIKAFRGEGGFKQFLSITGYAYTITVLSLIVTSAVSYFTGSLNMQLSVTGLANLLPQDMAGTFIYGVLNGLELFTIWQYAVIGIGIARVSKLSRAKVYSIIAVLYTLVLIYYGFAAKMSGMYV